MVKKKAAETVPAEHSGQHNIPQAKSKAQSDSKTAKHALAAAADAKPASAGKKRAKDEIDAIFRSQKQKTETKQGQKYDGQQPPSQDLQEMAKQVAEKVCAVSAASAESRSCSDHVLCNELRQQLSSRIPPACKSTPGWVGPRAASLLPGPLLTAAFTRIQKNSGCSSIYMKRLEFQQYGNGQKAACLHECDAVIGLRLLTGSFLVNAHRRNR